jgi:Na+-transporting NADH:ubiquinone oxidoreductase subunit C
MDVNKNSYTFGFAIIMVIVVGVVLSFAATSLKPKQLENVKREKMQDILSTVGFSKDETTREEAEVLYPEYIKGEYILDVNGQTVEGVAFDVDMKKEMKKPREERKLPIYLAEKDGKSYYILPLYGAGLWGPIWGYISLEEDKNTIFGASFDHEGETPGLGAEINKDFFEQQFIGKTIMENSEFVSVKVVKGGAQGQHETDGISGGTITSNGVSDMLEESISFYMPYFENMDGNKAQALK